MKELVGLKLRMVQWLEQGRAQFWRQQSYSQGSVLPYLKCSGPPTWPARHPSWSRGLEGTGLTDVCTSPPSLPSCWA